MTALNSIFTLIKHWEQTWFDDMRTSETARSEERADLEAQMRALEPSWAAREAALAPAERAALARLVADLMGEEARKTVELRRARLGGRARRRHAALQRRQRRGQRGRALATRGR